MYSRLLTSLMPLTLSAGCLVLRAEPVLDFSQALYLDSLAEISFAEGDIERCTALWREAASIAEESAVTEEDSLSHSGFLQPLGVCCHRMSMMDSTLSPTVRCTVMSLRATPCSPMRADIAIMESYPCRRQAVWPGCFIIGDVILRRSRHKAFSWQKSMPHQISTANRLKLAGILYICSGV